MADPQQNVPGGLADRMAVEGALVDLGSSDVAVKGILNAKGTEGKAVVSVFKAGGFTEYKDIKAPAKLLPEDLDRVRITSPKGETHYFRKLHSEEIDRLSTQDPTKTGAKAVVFVETDAQNNDLKVNGKKQVFIATPGYDGSPVEGNGMMDKLALKPSPKGKRSPQTESLFAIGDAKMYPPAPTMDPLLKAVTKETGKDIDLHLVSHSLGSGNERTLLIAAKAAGINVESSLSNDPVAASLAERRLVETFSTPPDQVGKLDVAQQALRKQFPEMTGDKVQAIFDEMKPKSVSVVAVKFDKDGKVASFSNVGYLETFKPKAGESEAQATQAQDQLRQTNMFSGKDGIKAPGRGGERNPLDAQGQDRDNKPPASTVVYVDMTDYADPTKRKSVSRTVAGGLDPTHPNANLVNVAADRDNPPLMATSIDALRDMRAARQKQQEPVKATSNNIPVPEGLVQTEQLMKDLLESGMALMEAAGLKVGGKALGLQVVGTGQAATDKGLG